MKKTVILIVITAALTLLVTGSCCLPSVNNTQKRIISYTRTELNETFGGSSAPLNGETVVNMLNKQEYSPDDRVDIIIEAKLPSLSEIYLKKVSCWFRLSSMVTVRGCRKERKFHLRRAGAYFKGT